jgi:hypothetical protein
MTFSLRSDAFRECDLRSRRGRAAGRNTDRDIAPKIGVRALPALRARGAGDQYLNNNYDVLGISAFYRFQ